MKKLKELKGAKELSKIEQQLVKGGGAGGTLCKDNNDCPSGQDCFKGVCFLSPKEFPDE